MLKKISFIIVLIVIANMFGYTYVNGSNDTLRIPTGYVRASLSTVGDSLNLPYYTYDTLAPGDTLVYSEILYDYIDYGLECLDCGSLWDLTARSTTNFNGATKYSYVYVGETSSTGTTELFINGISDSRFDVSAWSNSNFELCVIGVKSGSSVGADSSIHYYKRGKITRIDTDKPTLTGIDSSITDNGGLSIIESGISTGTGDLNASFIVKVKSGTSAPHKWWGILSGYEIKINE